MRSKSKENQQGNQDKADGSVRFESETNGNPQRNQHKADGSVRFESESKENPQGLQKVVHGSVWFSMEQGNISEREINCACTKPFADGWEINVGSIFN